MDNPFPYEQIAKPQSFYGRKNEIKELTSHIQNSTNVLLFSKRRMGKSTLIKNLFSSLKNRYIVIYIDIFNIITAEDFAKLLLNAITNSQKDDIKTSIKQFTKLFTKIRVEPTYDPKTGNMGIKPVIEGSTFEELIDDAFSALYELSKKAKIALAIDEFQQISTIKDVKIDALLRKYIQKPYDISYIFSGSKRNTLNSLFQYKSPLFEMATPMSLKAIEFEDIFGYVQKHLDIDKNLVYHIYQTADKETKFIQMIFHKLFVKTEGKKEITEDLIDEIINDILISKNDHYRTIFEILSQNQKKAFKALAIYKKELFSNKTLRQIDISRASMQSSLKQLYQKEFIDKEDNIWFIPDRIFEMWGEKMLKI